MKKNLKSVKASMTIGILIVSMFMMIWPAVSADESAADAEQGGLIAFNHIVNIQWLDSENDTLPIEPFADTRNYQIQINHRLSRGPLGAGVYQWFYAGRKLDMKIVIKDYPSEWSEVTAFQDTVQISLPEDLDKDEDYTYSLSISIDDAAPAFQRGKITLGITIEEFGIIDAYNNDLNLEINPDYAPKLNVIAESQSNLIGPMDTVSVPIKVTNLGNGESKIFFDVENIPTGWTVLVTDQITLAPDQTGTTYLTVKPPRGFGYHDDVHTFKVVYYPAFSSDISKRGPEEQVTISVESRGISLIGGEIIFPIIILIIVAIYLIYYFIRKIK
jgi:hypothetical protein